MNNGKILLEVCADSVDSALIAQTSGASRIEYCNNLPEGGTTPSYAQIEMARKFLQIKLYVLIRPRGGDFLYNDMEFEIMKSEVEFCGKAGCDGVVIGMLHGNGKIDKEHCKKLIDIAHEYKMGVTFHRAFDRCCDLFQGLEDVIELGSERILTSGGFDSAERGMEVIRKLNLKAGNRITIMPGAGITSENIREIVVGTGCKEFHGTFRSRVKSKMYYKNPEVGSDENEYSRLIADPEKIKTALQLLNR